MLKIKSAEYYELPEVYKVVGRAFEKPAGYFKNFVEMNPFYRGDDFFIAKIDGEIAAAIQVLFREVYFNKERLLIGGIGQVATLPEYRGRGLAGKLLTASFEFMKKNRVAYSLLFAGPVPLYKKYGWKELPVHTISAEVNGKSDYKIPKKYNIKKYVGNLNYNLFQMHNDYIYKFNNCVIRNTVYWGTYHNKFKAKDSDLYMLEDKGKELLAYIGIAKEGQRVIIREYASKEVKNDEYFEVLFKYILSKYNVSEVFLSAGNNFYMPYYILKKKYKGTVRDRTGFMVQNIVTRINWSKSMNKILFFEHDNF